MLYVISACSLVQILQFAGVFTMLQSVEHSWSRLHSDVSSSTLYCSVHGSLSRTSFSTFQSVSCTRETKTCLLSSHLL